MSFLDFEKITKDIDTLKKGLKDVNDLKGDVKTIATELTKFNKSSKRLIPVLERLAPILEQGLPMIERGIPHLETMTTTVQQMESMFTTLDTNMQGLLGLFGGDNPKKKKPSPSGGT